MRRFGEGGQSVAGHRPEMARPLDGVLDGAMAVHEADGAIEIPRFDSPLFQHAPPERPVGVRAAAVGQHHRQRDLALTEIVADPLAPLFEAYGHACAFTGRSLRAEAAADPRGYLLNIGSDPLTVDPTLLIPASLEAIHAYERGELSPSPDHFERVAAAA